MAAPDSGLLEDWTVDSALAYYRENGRIQAIEPVVTVAKLFADGQALDFNVTFDSLSGSSPNGALTSHAAQTFASPSGKASHGYTTAPGQLPVDPNYQDNRIALSGNWSVPVTRTDQVSVGGKLSAEDDFISATISASIAHDFNDKNTTLSLGVNDEYDALQPIGGAPVPGSDYSLSEKKGHEKKNGVGVFLGITQVITRNWLSEFNVSVDRFKGYLNDPYKITSIIDAAGNTTGYEFESRPDERTRKSAYWENRVAWNRQTSTALSLRYMRDDWGIRSDTAQLHLRWSTADRGWYIEPNFRWYRQTAADFYTPFILDTDAADHPQRGLGFTPRRLSRIHVWTEVRAEAAWAGKPRGIRIQRACGVLSANFRRAGNRARRPSGARLVSGSQGRAGASRVAILSAALRVEARGEDLTGRLLQRHGEPLRGAVAGEADAAALEIGTLVAQEAWRIEKKFSRYRSDSVTAWIHANRDTRIEVDEETASLIDFAGRCFTLSEGLFDVTSGVLRHAWKFDGSDRVPDAAAIERLMPFVGFDKLQWQSPGLILPGGMELDFGGIGKEYAVDRAYDLAAARRPTPFLINFGGDLRANGPPPRGPWQIGIERPDSDREATLILELEHGALATSGDSRRYLKKDGVRYGHILGSAHGLAGPAFTAFRNRRRQQLHGSRTAGDAGAAAWRSRRRIPGGTSGPLLAAALRHGAGTAPINQRGMTRHFVRRRLSLHIGSERQVPLTAGRDHPLRGGGKVEHAQQAAVYHGEPPGSPHRTARQLWPARAFLPAAVE